jgi:general secretion pathway protein G
MSANRRRPAFTLVELLVVLAILGILAGLLYAGISAVMGRRPMVETRSDLIGLQDAFEKFKAKFGVYPPSSLWVGNVSNATMKAAHPNDYRILTTIWPNIDYQKAFGDEGMDMDGTGALNLTNPKDAGSKPPKGWSGWTKRGMYQLTGDQCLVLFLGGFHRAPYADWTESAACGCVGLSTNPMNPFEVPNLAPDRIKPFFDFRIERLFQRDTQQAQGSSSTVPTTVKPFLSYGDGWFKQMMTGVKGVAGGSQQYPCYAYFNSQGPTASTTGDGFYGDNDCSVVKDALGNFPRPMLNLNDMNPLHQCRYVNPNSFQIMSSGPDMLWGAARLFPASAPVPKDIMPAGLKTNADIFSNKDCLDNLTNFFSDRLSGS